MARAPASVLFACTLNSVRSPMAAALARHYFGSRLFVDSAGVRAEDVDPFAVAVMAELGIDLSRHTAKSFDELEDTSFDVCISLSAEAQHRAVELTRTMDCDIEFWPTHDPTLVDGSREARLEAYRDVRDELSRRIIERFAPGRRP